jgi:hypothetical protein
MKKWKRKCPKCGIELFYKTKNSAEQSIKNNKLCGKCCNIGQIPWNKGIPCKEKTKKKIGDANRGNVPWNKGKKYKARKEKTKWIRNCPNCKNEIYYSFRNSMIRAENLNRLCRHCSLCGNKYTIGNKNHFGKPHSSKTKRILRLKKIEWIEKNKNNGYQIHPGYNPKACYIIDEYGKQNGYNFQHAMNGGEHYIKELGYWVDGYDKNKNVVIEYYEKNHKQSIKKDRKRIKEIKTFLKCQVIIIREWTNQTKTI